MDPSLVFTKSEHQSQAKRPITTQDTKAWAVSEIAQMIWGAKPTPHIFQAKFNVARDKPHFMQFQCFRALNNMTAHVPPNDVERDETH